MTIINDITTKYQFKRNKDLIGTGSYGSVFKARDRSGKGAVALKEISSRDHGIHASTIREANSLKLLVHPNIVRMIRVEVTQEAVYLVLEYIQSDLKRRMNSRPLEPDETKKYLKQILEGLHYIHSKGFLHRDLKPDNLLLDHKTSTLKLADFGMSREYCIPTRPYSPKVMTPSYTPPEISIAKEPCNYITSADMWSVGCIFAEMVQAEGGKDFRKEENRLLFFAESELDQVKKTFSFLGVPSIGDWPKHDFSDVAYKNLATKLPNLGQEGLDLLLRMLASPSRRINARDALVHPFFSCKRPTNQRR